MSKILVLEDEKKLLYEKIRNHHFEQYGFFGNQFPSWDYFGEINEEGKKILKKIRNSQKKSSLLGARK